MDDDARAADEAAASQAANATARAANTAAPAASEAPAAELSRRRVLLAAAGGLGGSLAALALTRRAPAGAPSPPAAPASSVQRAPGFATQLFEREQALLVEDLAELMLPESDSPGASRAGVPAYVEDIVREVYDEPERQAFLLGLDAANAEARAAHGRAFHECTGAEREALLALWLERCAPSFETGAPWCFFQAFRALCIEGFCQSRLGATRVLQYEAVPGEYRGCVPLAEVGRAWAT